MFIHSSASRSHALFSFFYLYEENAWSKCPGGHGRMVSLHPCNAHARVANGAERAEDESVTSFNAGKPRVAAPFFSVQPIHLPICRPTPPAIAVTLFTPPPLARPPTHPAACTRHPLLRHGRRPPPPHGQPSAQVPIT